MAVVGLQRARSKRRLGGGDVPTKKMKKTTSDVPEIKLFKLFIIGLKKKDNGEAALCWSHFIFFPEKQHRYNII